MFPLGGTTADAAHVVFTTRPTALRPTRTPLHRSSQAVGPSRRVPPPNRLSGPPPLFRPFPDSCRRVALQSVRVASVQPPIATPHPDYSFSRRLVSGRESGVWVRPVLLQHSRLDQVATWSASLSASSISCVTTDGFCHSARADAYFVLSSDDHGVRQPRMARPQPIGGSARPCAATPIAGVGVTGKAAPDNGWRAWRPARRVRAPRRPFAGRPADSPPHAPSQRCR